MSSIREPGPGRAADVLKLIARVQRADLDGRWEVLEDLTGAVADCLMFGGWDQHTARALESLHRNLSAENGAHDKGQPGIALALSALYGAMRPADRIGAQNLDARQRAGQMATLIAAPVPEPLQALVRAAPVLTHSIVAGDPAQLPDSAIGVLIARKAATPAQDSITSGWETLVRVAQRVAAATRDQAAAPVPTASLEVVRRSQVASGRLRR